MKKSKILVINLLIILFSCKKEGGTSEKKIKKEEKITLVFPDTVYINEAYDGKIDYINDLDTITTSFDDLQKSRYIYYSYTKTKNISYVDNYLKKIRTDTCGARNNRLIPLYNIKFDKLGLNYFDGIITDEVMIENGAKGKKGEPMTRIITDEIRLTRGVYVIERPKK
jgi:hypothetical protein